MDDTIRRKSAERADDRPTPTASAETDRAWEMVDSGRYMPRRIRGSFRGRELG